MTAPCTYRNLNAQQLAAVQYRGANLLVEAGAGTGKTEMLAHRAAALLHDGGMLPHQLWLSTFTRSAARSLRQRIAGLTANGDLITSGTLHSLALRLIRQYGWAVGMDAGAEVLDRASQVALIGHLAKEHGGLPPELPARRVAELISLEANTGRSLADLCRSSGVEQHAGLCMLLQDESLRYRRDNGLLDYDDLLYVALDIIAARGEYLAAEECRHLMIDEGQDISNLQLQFIAAFAALGVRITVVGDRMQSIYGWRGADAAMMDRYLDLPGSWHRITLHHNYRCPEPVLQAANPLALRQGGVALRSGKNGPSVLFSTHPTEQAEADFVAHRISELLRQGVPPADIAVLYRSSLHAIRFEGVLHAKGVAYAKYGGLQADSAALKDMAALLRLSIGEHQPALCRVLQLCPGIGEATARKMADAWPDCKVPSKAQSRVEDLRNCLALMRVAATPAAVWQLAEAFRPCPELEDAAASCASCATVREWLDSLALDLTTEQRPSQGITLATVHWAKGREFRYVFLLGCTQGRFIRQGNAEDERVLFVAMTRAAQSLALSSPLFFHDGTRWCSGHPYGHS